MSKPNSPEESSVSQFAAQLDRIEKLLVDLHRKLDGGHHETGERITTAQRIIDAGKTGGDPLAVALSTSKLFRTARKRHGASK